MAGTKIMPGKTRTQRKWTSLYVLNHPASSACSSCTMYDAVWWCCSVAHRIRLLHALAAEESSRHYTALFPLCVYILEKLIAILAAPVLHTMFFFLPGPGVLPFAIHSSCHLPVVICLPHSFAILRSVAVCLLKLFTFVECFNKRARFPLSSSFYCTCFLAILVGLCAGFLFSENTELGCN